MVDGMGHSSVTVKELIIIMIILNMFDGIGLISATAMEINNDQTQYVRWDWPHLCYCEGN